MMLGICGCGDKGRAPSGPKRLTVVATLFPLYDFARNVAGDRADVTQLLPPGVEAHSWEPKPQEILRIHNADIFIYTGPFMEPWAEGIIKGSQGKALVVVDSGEGVTLRPEVENDADHGHDHGHADAHGRPEPVDPHIWLDLGNAQKMVDNIAAGFIKKDPEGRAVYEKNAAVYKAALQQLDEKFVQGLAGCRTRLFVHGGHYAFNYLARRYNLTYVSAYGFSPNAEPSPRHITDIVKQMKRSGTTYIFYEELLQPRIAETIARETGATLLRLNVGHNVTKDEKEKGVTFISLLDGDLANLRTGLQCR
jgi:zinc transport system substrate-binding protein